MLSSTGLIPPPPLPTDGFVIAPPPAPAVATGLKAVLPPTVPAGMPTLVVVGAVDAAGLPARGYNGSVTVTSSDPSATVPASVKLVDGRAIVTVTFATSGSQTLTFTDSADASITGLASTTVAAAPVAARVVVMMPAQVRAGVPTTVTALAVDAAGRPVPTFSGSATVASSDTAAALPMVEVLFKNGRATFQVAFATTGPQTLTVTSLSDAKVTGTASTTVAAPQTLGSFFVIAPPRIIAGTAVDVTIMAMDVNRRPMPGYAGTATLVSSDAAAAVPATVTFKGGRATARVTFPSPGSPTLTVRGGAAGDIVATATLTVVAAPVATRFAMLLPRAVPAGLPVPVTIMALDAQGRPVPTFSGTATISSSDPAAKLPSSVTFVNGRALVRVTFTTLGEQTLTVASDTITATGKTRVGQVTVQPMA